MMSGLVSSKYVRRHLRKILMAAIAVIFTVMLCLLVSVQSRPAISISQEDSDFYHDFDNDLPVHRKTLESKVHVDTADRNFIGTKGRKRTLNTSAGVVHVKDVFFVPKNKFPPGANVYKVNILQQKNPLWNKEKGMGEEQELLWNNDRAGERQELLWKDRAVDRQQEVLWKDRAAERQQELLWNRDRAVERQQELLWNKVRAAERQQERDYAYPLDSNQKAAAIRDSALKKTFKSDNRQNIPQLELFKNMQLQRMRNQVTGIPIMDTLRQYQQQQQQQQPGKFLEPRLSSKDGRCTVAPCKEYLSFLDSPHFKYCSKKSRLRPDNEPLATTCKFRRANPNAPSVGLASSPGSGADQVRDLLQKVTGLCTGSTTCDTRLRVSGFAGECLRSRTVLVVKTHQVEPWWSGVPVNRSQGVPKGFNKVVDVPVFESAVYLIRDPYEAMLEEWARLSEVDPDPARRWDTFVSSESLTWQQTMVNWLVRNRNHSLLAVQLENIRRDIKGELLQILDFLDVPYSSTKLNEVSWQEKEEASQKVQDSFNADQMTHVNTIITKTAKMLSTHAQARGIELSHYIKHTAL